MRLEPEYGHERARSNSELLWRAVTELNAKRTFEDFEEFKHGLSIVDMQQDLIEFQDDIALLKEIDERFPALVIDEVGIPISLSSFGLGWPSAPSFFGDSQYREYKKSFVKNLIDNIKPNVTRVFGNIENFSLLELDQAHANFRANLTISLALRMTTVKQSFSIERHPSTVIAKLPPRIGVAANSTIGCQFTVTSNAAGLRVFWSGAYYIKAHFFGSPTTPITGVLQSGNYIFGVDGGLYGNSIQWDQQAICSLPGAPTVHLNF